MAEEKKEEFAFLKEKIIEKPVNKKRLFRQGGNTVLFAILFGTVASFVFSAMSPVMDHWLHPKEDPTISIPGDEWGTQQDEPGTQEFAETEKKEEQPEPVVPEEAPSIEKELELSDYQMLQNKIYAIGKEANRSVVTVTSVVSDMDWYNNAFESNGQASGIIIGDNGSELLILTEHKAVWAAEEIRITFINDVTVPAYLKKYDGNTGIAILSVGLEQLEESTKSRISYAVLGNSLAVAQGNVAIAIGSPLGTNYSIGTGNITSVGNVIQTADMTYTVFTTDIVGSSSSGGVLLDLDGEVIGLVMQDYSGNGDDNTLTALSISELKKLIEMMSNGKDIPYLGLRVVTVTDRIARDYDIPRGVYIKEAILDSPALIAGLQGGDVIVKIDGKEIASVDEYEEKVLSLEPGQATEVTVKRLGMDEYLEVSCTVTAGILP